MSVATDELRASLRETVADVLDAASSSERVRALFDDPVGFDPDLWRQMGALGWLGLEVPERFGGSGAGFAELAVVLDELGRHVTPAPILGSTVLASAALVDSGREHLAEHWLPRLTEGQARGAAVLGDDSGRVGADRLGIRSTPAGASRRLTGVAGFVPDADGADCLVVAAREEGEVVLALLDALTPGISIEPVVTVDRTRRLATVRMEDVPLEDDAVLATGPQAAAQLDRLVARGRVAVAADATGAARRSLEQSVDYAKERHQFGRPVGSFQAVKHRCADMLIRVEGAAAAVADAVDALVDGPGRVATATAVATAYAGDATVAVTGDAIQVHGGVGFTWEFDCHLFFKRALLDRELFGDPRSQREVLAAGLDPRGAP